MKYITWDFVSLLCVQRKRHFRKNNFQELSCKKHIVYIVLKKTIPSKYCDILSVLQNNLAKVVGKQ